MTRIIRTHLMSKASLHIGFGNLNVRNITSNSSENHAPVYGRTLGRANFELVKPPITETDTEIRRHPETPSARLRWPDAGTLAARERRQLPFLHRHSREGAVGFTDPKGA